MFTVPKLTKLADQAIKELQGSGIQPTPEEILLLNRLGELSLVPNDFELLSFCYQSYGNLKVYPLTLGAKLWLQRFEQDHPTDTLLQSMAVLYALANSRHPEAMDFESDDECKKVLTNFASGINLTEEEIQKLMAKVTPESVEGKKSITPEGFKVDEEITMIPALALLMHTFGRDTQYWLWQETEEIVGRYILEAIKINSEQNIKVNDRSLLAFAEIKKTVARIKRERSPVPPVVKEVI